MKKLFILILSLACTLSLFACGEIGNLIDVDVNTSTAVSTEIVSDAENVSGEFSLDEQTSEQVSVSDEINITSEDTLVFLGDSIAEGYALASPENERYSTLIANKYGCAVYNYAVAGDDGADLIALLDSGSCTELKNATAVVISIGANNVLSAAESLLPTLGDALETGEIPEGLDLSATMTLVTAGVSRFKTELPQIIEKIRAVNPNAQIVLQTVYNPYRDFEEVKVEQNGFKITFASFSATCVNLVNSAIEEYAAENNCTVCEVYTPFDEYEGSLINANLEAKQFDPHPNADGHKLLAELVAEVIE